MNEEVLKKYHAVFADVLNFASKMLSFRAEDGRFWPATLNEGIRLAGAHGDVQIAHDLINTCLGMAESVRSGNEVPDCRQIFTDAWRFFRNVCENGDFTAAADAYEIKCRYGNDPFAVNVIDAAMNELARIREGSVLENGYAFQRRKGKTEYGMHLAPILATANRAA